MCIRDSVYVNNNPEPPKMNSLIKIHKLNNPIRSLINFKTARTNKIAKMIAGKLKSNHLTNIYHNIKNTYKLVDNLNVININENTFFTSHDITNMYINIPVAVSYTHLDVYKRQAQTNSIG